MAARELLPCKECDRGKRVLGRCESCNIFMCEDCLSVHQLCGLNLSDEQKNVGLSDVPGNPLFNREIICEFHNHIACGFCSGCEVFVCPICIPQSHNGHTLSEMEIGIQFSSAKLRTFKSRLDQDIVNLFRDQATLQSLRKSEKIKYVEEKRKLKQQVEMLKRAIDERMQALLLELDKQWDVLDKRIKEEENNIQRNGHSLEDLTTHITQVLDTNDTGVLLDSLKKATLYEGPKHIHTNFQLLHEFVPGSFTQCIIESLLGTLVSRNQNASVEIDIKATEHYVTDLPFVDNILCCPDGSNLINSKSNSSAQSGELQHVALLNGAVQTKEKFLVDFANMALLPSKELLVTVNESSLKVLSNTTGKLENRYSVAPFRTTEALHVTPDYKIIVGTTKGQYSSGEKQVVMLNMKGEQEMVYALDNNDKQLFTDTTPFKVTSDNENIYVLDKNRYKGRIVILKRIGGVKSIYNGAKTPSHGSFVPKDLTISKSGQVITCDETMLYILNKEGQCMKYQELYSDLKVKEIPLCLDVDMSGMLLMGCRDTIETNAKIYVFRLFGC